MVEVTLNSPTNKSVETTVAQSIPQPAAQPAAQPQAKQQTAVVASEITLPPAKKTARPKVLPTAKRIKTVEHSNVAVEAKSEKVELEELSPIIAEEPATESSSSTPASSAVSSDADSSPEAQVAPVTAEPTQEPSAVNKAATATAIEESPTATVSEPSLPSKPSTDSGANKGPGSGTGTASGASVGGTTDGTPSGGNEKPTTIVEASLRRPFQGNPLPKYPAQDRLRKHQGTSVVLGDVRRDGTMENVRLDKISGSRDMDSASINTFKKWKFAPGPEATVRKAFQFNLQGEAQVGYATLKR